MYAGSEVVELGVQIEKNGYDFYKTLVEQSKSEKAISVFKYLAEQERNHILDFKKILNSVQQYEPSESYPDEYFVYMNALAGDHVFTKENKGKEIAQTMTDDKQALDIALKFEKDSITFYEGMNKIVSENDAQLIDKLIREEQKHVIDLTELKKFLG